MAHGEFVWFELVTPDIDQGKAFYPAVAGLGTTGRDMGSFTYTMLTQGEAPQAGVVNPQTEGVPAHWASYLSVGDVDASCAAVLAHGGSALAEAFDVPTVGRMAPVADPEGAAFVLFSPSNPEGGQSTAFHWNELWSKDPAAVLPFYQAVFGLTVEEMQMPQGTCYVLKSGDTSVGGVVASNMPEAPPMWLPYLAVDDCDVATDTAKGLGAKTHLEPTAVPGVGRFSILSDNSGAVIGLIKPDARGH